ncbi:LegC family aminotransferase [Candidatus Pelagibacter sp.]|nr:LegC family aminotransferase [Candidatus Pelagibacter sp.]
MKSRHYKEFDNIINFIRKIYKSKSLIPLHEPKFYGNEKKYLNECVDSTFVSSAGKFVDQFEKKFARYVGTKYAVATNSGTSALHISLLVANTKKDDEIITQPLTFVATCNAISYCGAKPIFVDVDKKTMGMSSYALKIFLEKNTKIINGKCINKKTGNTIRACIPMHTYGHPCKIDEIKKICRKYFLVLIEDAAESVGSFYKNKHTGTFGNLGVMSFNGNKIITSGGGGCIVTNNIVLAKRAKHLSMTAKKPHKWNFNHDTVGYNYRMQNLNAALLIAQLEKLKKFIYNKRILAQKYENFFKSANYKFFIEPKNSKSNYWLNSIIFKNKNLRDKFLLETNKKQIMTRPIWTLMNKLPMFRDAQCENLVNSEWLYNRVVNIPSSVT